MSFPLLAQATDTAAQPAAGANPDVVPPPPPSGLELFRSFEWGDMNSDQWWEVVAKYGVEWGSRILLALIILYIAWTLAGWAAMVVQRGLGRMKFDATLTKFLSKLARWLTLLLAGIACMSYLGIETTSFAALIGAAGLALGLAFQGTLSNFAAGGMLLLFRPFKVGDAVNVAGQLGIVDEISIFVTSVDTFDNRRIIIPNSEIFGSVIENITHHPVRRVDGDVGVSYSADIDRTRALLEEVAANVEGVTSDKDPAVILLGLGGSSVDWSVRVWAPTGDYMTVKQRLLRDIKVRLDREGIEIPFPQMDVHITQQAG